jgi:hypothetical protein
MTKRVAYLLMGLMALMAFMPTAAEAAPPIDADGDWEYFTELTEPPSVAGCNTFLTLAEEDTLTGTFNGTSNPDKSWAVVTVHCSGSGWVKGQVVFDEVTVDGRTGGLVMRTNGRLAADPGSEWTGQWVIVSATGELEGLHGQGKWWGPGAGGPGLPGFLEYDGKVHFHPNS